MKARTVKIIYIATGSFFALFLIYGCAESYSSAHLQDAAAARANAERARDMALKGDLERALRHIALADEKYRAADRWYVFGRTREALNRAARLRPEARHTIDERMEAYRLLATRLERADVNDTASVEAPLKAARSGGRIRDQQVDRIDTCRWAASRLEFDRARGVIDEIEKTLPAALEPESVTAPLRRMVDAQQSGLAERVVAAVKSARGIEGPDDARAALRSLDEIHPALRKGHDLRVSLGRVFDGLAARDFGPARRGRDEIRAMDMPVCRTLLPVIDEILAQAEKRYRDDLHAHLARVAESIGRRDAKRAAEVLRRPPWRVAKDDSVLTAIEDTLDHAAYIYAGGAVGLSSYVDRCVKDAVEWQVAAQRNTVRDLEYFVNVHPGSPYVAAARRRIVDLEVNDVFAADHGTLPEAKPVAKAAGKRDRAIINIHNATAYLLSVCYSGPEAFKVEFASGERGSVEMLPGSYRVAASVTAKDVTRYAGPFAGAGGQIYGWQFVVRTTTVGAGGLPIAPPRIRMPSYRPPAYLRGPSITEQWDVKRPLPAHLRR